MSRVAQYAHCRCGHNFIKLEANEGLEPSPEEEVCLIENHPRNEERSEEANYRSSNGAVTMMTAISAVKMQSTI